LETPVIPVSSFLRNVLDAVPISVFVVDEKLKILDLNKGARHLCGDEAGLLLSELCGHVLNCVNAVNSPGGCGTGDNCPQCVIRNVVGSAERGRALTRKKVEMYIKKGDETVHIYLLVSASPFEYEGQNLILLTLEDITEIMELRRFLPICSYCKKIRNDEEYWENVDTYLRKQTGMEFSHGICPDCLKLFYPDLVG
jgi:nitrogen fixation/metabolism regulation signal transduction histidine kinase